MLGPIPTSGWKPAMEAKTALKGNAVIRRLSLTVARLFDSTTGRRRSAYLTRGGLTGVGPSSGRKSLLGGSECRLFDLNPFSHDPFDPFVDPTLTMESGQKRGPSGQFRGD